MRNKKFTFTLCAYIIFSFNFLHGKESLNEIIPLKFQLGLTSENFQSRYVNSENSTKENFFIESIWDSKMRVFGEKRENQFLGSFSWKEKFFYFSIGNRYKPFSGFYLLRDERFYSAFQNPNFEIVEQPILSSRFFGFRFQEFGLGAFLGDGFSKKKPAFYFHTPKDIFAFAYSKENELYFASLNLKDWKPSSHSVAQLRGEGIGKKDNYLGYLNGTLFFPDSGYLLELSTFREGKGGSLFSTTADRFREELSTKSVFFRISRNFYDRAFVFRQWSELGRSSIFEGNLSLFSFTLGAICLGGRIYREEPKDSLVTQVFAGSLSYEWKKRGSEIQLRTENRKNGDKLSELKFTIRPSLNWKFELSSLFQGENKLRSLYEQWSDGENINFILTDRTTAIKVKVLGPMLSVNLSASRTRSGQEFYFANLQFRLEY
ncbi:MAG: hypothetical protein N3A69_01385 [Leptospiraceae bacterium]|nr:hypothetical protein [Leptospiraceae bacterium]